MLCYLSVYLKVYLCLFLALGSGCASLTNRREASLDAGNADQVVQFAGTANVCALKPGDLQVQFFERSLSLSKVDLVIGGERIALREIDSMALYPGDVTHPNQLQIQVDRRLLVIQMQGAFNNKDDQRTLPLYDQLSASGVPRGRTDTFYYVGMNLEAVKRDQDGDGFFAAAAGARVGGFIWDSIKGLGSLLVKPFVPLF